MIATTYRFSIRPEDPRLKGADIRVLLEQATEEAVADARSEKHEISAQAELEGGFGGLGEVTVVLSLIVHAGAEVAKTAALAAAGAAGKMFFEKYLAPQLRKHTILSSHLRPATAAHRGPGKKSSKNKSAKHL